MQYFVNAHHGPAQDGTRLRPFATISQAAAVARPGDEVVVMPGVYREWVDPPLGGTDEEHRIVYRSFLPSGAVVTGSEELRGWQAQGDGVYRAEVDNALFPGRNPYTETIHGDWYYAEEGFSRHLGEIYMDGESLYEASSLEALTAPEPSLYSAEKAKSQNRWFTRQENGRTAIYVFLCGRDPNAEAMELSVRSACFFPTRTGRNYITVSGFRFQNAATQWAPPTAFQEGMVGPNWARGWIVENCELRESKCCGISLGKYRQHGSENKWTERFLKDGTQTQRETVLQALREGWTKENIGSHIVRGCEIHHCGQAGIVGHMGCAFSRIEGCHVHHINDKKELAGAEIAGIKLHAPLDVTVSGCHIHHCTRGLWLDWQAQGTRVTQNAFHHNEPPAGTELRNSLDFGEDLFVEVSHGPTLIDHNLFLSAVSARVSTQGFAFCHNLFAGAFTYVGDGVRNTADRRGESVRYTPYHVPHQTDVAGFMTILSGDGRFYQNVFVRQDRPPEMEKVYTSFTGKKLPPCGTSPWDGWPDEAAYYSAFNRETAAHGRDTGLYYGPLPMAYGGNVYCNGALPAGGDRDAFICPDKVSLQVLGGDGRWVLSCDYGRFLPKGPGKPVDTALLGLAFEPEQPFENPDGSPLALTEDYLGQPEETGLPGPFAAPLQGAWILQEKTD